MYDKSFTKINHIGPSGFVLKTKYNKDKSDLEKKIIDTDKKLSDASGLVKKTDYNPKVSELESKIRSFSELATRAALIAVKNRTPNVSNLVKKKQIIMQTYQKLKVNALLQLIIINLLKILFLIK